MARAFEKTEESEWIDRRVAAVGRFYSAYQALVDKGIEIPDEQTSFQILCPFHGDKNKPSARYYAQQGQNLGHFWCFKCKIRLDGVGLYAKFNGIKFMEALTALERRFGVRVPRRPESTAKITPSERKSDYVSEAWSDTPRLLEILEKKLARVRDRCSLPDYVKLCRLLDTVSWDFDHAGKTLPAMTDALRKAAALMDDIMSTPDDPLEAG